MLEAVCSAQSFVRLFSLQAVSHSSRFHLWQEGSLASQGVQMFAERGVTAALIKETKEVKKSTRSVHGVYRAPGISNGIGHTSTELHMQPRSPRVRLGTGRLL